MHVQPYRVCYKFHSHSRQSRYKKKPAPAPVPGLTLRRLKTDTTKLKPATALTQCLLLSQCNQCYAPHLNCTGIVYLDLER